MSIWPYTIIGLIIVERAAELIYSRRNTLALRARGAIEIGQRRYPLMVAVHAAWLIAIVGALPADGAVHWAWVAVLALLQPPRLWTIMALGPYWTTRILILPDAPLIRTGPYRFLRHPAYLIAALEIAVVPLALGEMKVAAAFFLINAVVMTIRAREEDAALAVQRSSIDSEPAGALSPTSPGR